MKAVSLSLRAWWPALAGSFVFVLLAVLLIPYPGVQEDETIFGPPIYHPELVPNLTVGVHVIPLMLMTYLGATKTWLYAAIFKLWAPSAASIRVPVILIFAFTIWIFYAVLRMIHSSRAAAAGALILSTDPIYVMTGSFGWCNLQNVFMLAAMGAFLKFHRSHSRMWLAVAMFSTGLWVWDKALALWILSGLVLALLVLFPRVILDHINWANIGVGLAAFCVGAFPLIFYNVENEYPTLSSNAHFSTAGFYQKLFVLKITADGSIWQNYFVNEQGAQNPRVPQTRIERWSAAVHDHVGEHRSDDLLYAFAGSLLLLPMLLIWRRYSTVRLLCFSLIVMSVAWLQMALTVGAGSGGHHPALMWPFPQLFIAVAFAEASFRWKAAGGWLLAAAVAILMVSNMLTVNQYLYQLARFGAAGSWSDAIYALSDQMSGFQAGKIFTADWGMVNPLSTLSRGKLPLQSETYAFSSDDPAAALAHEALKAFAEKNAIWVAHASGNETFPGANARLEKMAAAAGYRKVTVSQVQDRNQRPIFEVFRIVPGPSLLSNTALSNTP